MLKIDHYAGGREDILDMWPDSHVPANMHIHTAHDGGYYNHTHAHGQVRHFHDVSKEERGVYDADEYSADVDI